MNEYDKSKPIYDRNCETSSGHPWGGGLACDYSNHPAVPNSSNLMIGIHKCIELFCGLHGVILPFQFWDTRILGQSNDETCEPLGGYGWQHWKDDDGCIKTRFHTGTDHPQVIGTVVRSVLPGIVICADQTGAGKYGKGIVVHHGTIWREYKQWNLYTLYAHCSDVTVRPESKINAGDFIATVGNSGHSSGAHLHFEYKIRPLEENPGSCIGDDLRAWDSWKHTLNPRLFDTREVIY